MKTGRTLSVRDEYRAVKAEYAYNGDVMSEDSPRVAVLKKIVQELPITDRTLILMYADCGNYRELGRKLGINYTTAFYRVRQVRVKIMARYNEIKYADKML